MCLHLGKAPGVMPAGWISRTTGCYRGDPLVLAKVSKPPNSAEFGAGPNDGFGAPPAGKYSTNRRSGFFGGSGRY